MKSFRKVLIAFLAMAAFGTAQAASMSDYLENRLTDWLLRGQTYAPPTTLYVALATASGSDLACGVEVSRTSTGYARAAVTSSLANWAGTQAAASTTASTGTAATTSNNGTVAFPTPTGNWGTVTEFCVYDSGITTLSGAVSDTIGTTITVTSAALFPSSGNFDVRIDNEIMSVTGGQGTTTWTVTRGARGTTAATHSNGADVSGLMLWRAALTVPKTINNGDSAPSFSPAALTFQVDN